MTDNKPIQHVVKYGPLQCPYFYCGKTFTSKKIVGSLQGELKASISLEAQAKTEEEYIAHCDLHHHKAMIGVTTLPYQRIR